jgi:hypothetical protein
LSLHHKILNIFAFCTHRRLRGRTRLAAGVGLDAIGASSKAIAVRNGHHPFTFRHSVDRIGREVLGNDGALITTMLSFSLAPLFTIHTGPCGPDYPGTIAAPSGNQTQVALHNHNHAIRTDDGRDANNGGHSNGLTPRRSRVRTLQQGIEVFSCVKAR